MCSKLFHLYCFQQVGLPLIDIKPGNDRNRINICAHGDLPVAILSFETFDATEVDPTTVFLAGAGVRRIGMDARPVTHTSDVNHDRITDLVVNILIEDLTLVPGDTEATLIGQTFDGTPIEGVDSVEIQQRMCERTL